MEMDKIKNILYDWYEKFKKVEETDNLHEKPKIEPLKHFREQKIQNEKNEKKKEEKKEEEKKEIKKTEGKKEENKKELEEIKEKGIFPVFEKLHKEKYREILEPDEIIKKVTNILLSGKLMKFYLWFNLKSSYFKSMNDNEQLNFQIESFIGTVITRSFIENKVLDALKMFDLSDFDEKEFEILEDFLIKFKKGKLQKELEKIKEEIRKAKIAKYKEMNLINQENEINTNLNNVASKR